MIRKGKPGAPKVLVVDDEIEVLESVVDLLRKEFDLVATTSADEAVHLLETEDVALLLTDQRMPKMLGSQLLARAMHISPGTTRILFTAYSDIEAVIQAVNKGQVYQYISKPWEPDRLLEIVRTATEKYSLAAENRRLIRELAATMDSTKEQKDSEPNAPTELDRLAQQNHELQAALDKLNNSFWHIERLRDLLPICMSCGKVEAEKGKWMVLLDFFKTNTLFLSHTYCPPCRTAFFDDEE